MGITHAIFEAAFLKSRTRLNCKVKAKMRRVETPRRKTRRNGKAQGKKTDKVINGRGQAG